MKKGISSILKKSQTKHISCLTSYTANTTYAIDGIVDMILVGDSMGMVLYGMPNTIPVTIELMLPHAKAVTKFATQSLVIFDMPFGSYESSKEEAFKNATLIMKETECDALKLEGGTEIAETVKFLTQRGIPVMGHLGLMPQKYKIKGNFTKESNEKKIIKDLRSLTESGVFSVVLENIIDDIAQKIAEEFPNLLTLGIGTNSCKGNIAVLEDLCGLSISQPPFTKPQKNMLEDIKTIATQYANTP